MRNSPKVIIAWYTEKYPLHSTVDLNALRIRMRAEFGITDTTAKDWVKKLGIAGMVIIHNVRNDVVERIK